MNVLTLDIGGTKTAAAIVTDEGHVGVRQLEPTPAREGADAVVATALAVARRAMDGYAVERVGVSSAGVVDSGAGRITHSTGLIAGWAGTSLGERLSRSLGLPVRVLNDVHAHALGEARHGAGRAHASMLHVAVGTGIGGAHVIDGRVVTGARGAAGHVGHVAVAQAADLVCSCGRTGHLEAIASGSALRRLGAMPGRSADEDLRTAGTTTGEAIGSLLNVLDPAVVVLSGGVSAAGEPWLTAVREGVRSTAMDVVAQTPVVLAERGDAAAHLGAAAFAAEAGWLSTEEEQ